MYKTYLIRNKISGSFYIGMTKQSLGQRWSAHKSSAKRGKKSKFYDAIRKYGIDVFEIILHRQFDTKEDCCKEEIHLISLFRSKEIPLYNLADGGQTGYVVPPEKKEEWRAKLSKSRQGAKPALGMKHTEENKRFFAECNKRKIPTYPNLDFSLGFTKNKKLFGISKTHYYRLLKQAKSNVLG